MSAERELKASQEALLFGIMRLMQTHNRGRSCLRNTL